VNASTPICEQEKNMPAQTPEPIEMESSVNIQTFLVFLMALTIGLLVAVLLLPSWLPNMAFSLGGDAPKVFWYLARATAFASLSLLWISMALGLSITNKMARLWPGAPAAFAIHEYVNLLGIAFAIFHALILLGDHYIGFTFVQVLMPFSTASYRPLWVGIGQLGFYVWLLVTLSFYIRQGIGQKTWRVLHYASFAMYLMGIFHGIFSGTDTGVNWVQQYYWISAGSLLFMLMYRILASLMEKAFPQKPQPRPAPAQTVRPTLTPASSQAAPLPATSASPTVPSPSSAPRVVGSS
jgi:predicted ferric reductase